MKFYTLEAVVRGTNYKFDRKFESRNEAIDYMFNFYNKMFAYNMEVNDEYAIDGNKHNVEYVCDQTNRFSINRVSL